MKTIPYNKFKHGQRVTCEINEVKIDDAKISIDKDGKVFICQNTCSGIHTDYKLGYKYSYQILEKNERYDEEYSIAVNLKFIPRTLEDLVEGDVVINSYGYEKKILGVCGKVYMMSVSNNFDSLGDFLTIKDMREFGYTLKQEDQEEEITELTLEDVANLANVPVEKLRIKD